MTDTITFAFTTKLSMNKIQDNKKAVNVYQQWQQAFISIQKNLEFFI